MNGTRFRLEKISSIEFHPHQADDYLVKGVIPREGVGSLFGATMTCKTFALLHLGGSVAAGIPWGGRAVKAAPVVYIAAEGAGGMAKRLAGLKQSLPGVARAPFYLIRAAPDLGSKSADLDTLIDAIATANVEPGLIIVDTLSATLKGADENGSGMMAFLANCAALAQSFRAFVLAAAHTGHADGAKSRERGHSSLQGNVDCRIEVTRPEKHRARLTVAKLKDEPVGSIFDLVLAPIGLGIDADGDPVTTLAIESVTPVTAAKPPAEAERLSADVQTLIEIVGSTAEMHIARRRFDEYVATKRVDGDTPEKLKGRQRQRWARAMKGATAAGCVFSDANGQSVA